MTITYNEVAKIAFSLKGVIFGGYVRDLLAGVEPKDMDIRFKNFNDIKDFLFLLLRSGDKVTLDSETEYSAGDLLKEAHYKVTVGSLSIDCLDRAVEKPLDFNVNGLEMTTNGIFVPETSGSLDMSMPRILECIQKREAVMQGKADAYRTAKMRDRGWTIVNLPQAHVGDNDSPCNCDQCRQKVIDNLDTWGFRRKEAKVKSDAHKSSEDFEW